MSEPITLYKDGEELIVTAPTWAKELLTQGWSLEPEADDVPFDFAPVADAEETETDIVPVKAKRGRTKKA